MTTSTQPVILIRKKRAEHAKHHGGAWKVAYADFVTAMMALFIVLWLMTASQDIQKSIAGYFRDPKGFGTKTGSALGGSGESLTITKSNMDLLKSELQQTLRQNPEFQKLKDHVLMTVTGEGLRIELLETEKGMFFENGQPYPTSQGKDLICELARQLGHLTNSIVIEGHTDSKPFDSVVYSNWELSADRANAARRIMEGNGLHNGQVTEVRGFADQHLRIVERPSDASNRRVSIVVAYAQDHIITVPPTALPASAKQTSTMPKSGPGVPGKPSQPSHLSESRAASKSLT